MRPACATTWWWKSTTGLAVGTVSERQGCPWWRGIWRKSDAKSRTDEKKLDTRLTWNGWACQTKQSPILPEFHAVNLAVTWEESGCAYPGRSLEGYLLNNLISDSQMNQEKSAEAIVVPSRNKGLNNLKSWKKQGGVDIPPKHRKYRGIDQKIATYRGMSWKRKSI